jgi:hypothetical protein
MKLVLAISLACATTTWTVCAADRTEAEPQSNPQVPTLHERLAPEQGEDEAPAYPGAEDALDIQPLTATDFTVKGPLVTEREQEDVEMPNAIVFEKFTLRGMAVQWFKTDNLLQLFNPLAPERYGSGDQNLVHDPVTRRPKGFTILAFDFGGRRDRR